VPSDDERLSRASRALRRQKGLTQEALVGPGRSRHIQSLLEGGQAGRLQLDDIRAHFKKLDATVRITAWWNGASLDRLVDADHATVIESGVREFQRYLWPVMTEVTFNEWGERGSIDLLAAREDVRTVIVGEAKSAWGSIEETIRVLDVKVRLAPTIAKDRFHWMPNAVAALLIFPEDESCRRVARQHAGTLGVTFPARNREIRRWLRKPVGPLRGLWFLSDVRKVVQPDEVRR
jgi:hypothetical protein